MKRQNNLVDEKELDPKEIGLINQEGLTDQLPAELEAQIYQSVFTTRFGDRILGYDKSPKLAKKQEVIHNESADKAQSGQEPAEKEEEELPQTPVQVALAAFDLSRTAGNATAKAVGITQFESDEANQSIEKLKEKLLGLELQTKELQKELQENQKDSASKKIIAIGMIIGGVAIGFTVGAIIGKSNQPIKEEYYVLGIKVFTKIIQK